MRLITVAVKLSCAQVSHHEGVWGNGDITPQFLTFELDEDDWPPGRPCRFIFGVTDPVPIE